MDDKSAFAALADEQGLDENVVAALTKAGLITFRRIAAHAARRDDTEALAWRTKVGSGAPQKEIFLWKEFGGISV